MEITLKKRSTLVIPSGDHHIAYSNGYCYITSPDSSAITTVYVDNPFGPILTDTIISSNSPLPIICSNANADIKTSVNYLYVGNNNGIEQFNIVGANKSSPVKNVSFSPQTGHTINAIINAYSDRDTIVNRTNNTTLTSSFVVLNSSGTILDNEYVDTKLHRNGITQIQDVFTYYERYWVTEYTPDKGFRIYTLNGNILGHGTLYPTDDAFKVCTSGNEEPYYDEYTISVGINRMMIASSWFLYTTIYPEDFVFDGVIEAPSVNDVKIHPLTNNILIATDNGIVIYDKTNIYIPILNDKYANMGGIKSFIINGNYVYAVKDSFLNIYEILTSAPTTTTPTTTPTTTETTTLSPRPDALKKVETILITPTQNSTGNDGSESKGTLNTIESSSMSFGPLASGETSETKIIYLRVPYAKTINDIKIALMDTDDITFASNTFGVEIHDYIDYNLIPISYFNGLNQDNLPSNLNNIDVGNNSPTSSKYVYVNITLPEDQALTSGVIKYKWYFSYV
jgi:hypothetical protein